MCLQHAAWAGNPDAVEKLVNDYGASLDLLAKDGRTALQVARDKKQKSTEQKLQQLANDAAKRKPEPPSEPSPSKKAKLGEATEEKSDVFGVWPTPMTGNGTDWLQFLSLFKPEIAALTSALGKSDNVKQLEVASVVRTAVRILDGRNKLKQWESAETKKWKDANGEADTPAKKAALEKHLKDSTPPALKVRVRPFALTML